MIWFHDMILNPLFLHLINSMTAHQNCLVGMHDTSYDTLLLSASQRCTDHLCTLCEFSSVCSRSGEKFQTFRPRGAATGVGLVGILITGNSDGVRTSSKSMCACGVLSRPRGKKLVKFGTSFDDRSFQTGASHMKDHGFPKGDVSIQTPVAGDFIVWPHKNFHGTQSPLYHGFDFLAHFRYR